MARVAAIGAEPAVQGFGLAGAMVCAADDVPAVLAAWHDLPSDIAVVVVTAAAARALPPDAFDRDWPMVAVLP